MMMMNEKVRMTFNGFYSGSSSAVKHAYGACQPVTAVSVTNYRTLGTADSPNAPNTRTSCTSTPPYQSNPPSERDSSNSATGITGFKFVVSPLPTIKGMADIGGMFKVRWKAQHSSFPDSYYKWDTEKWSPPIAFSASAKEFEEALKTISPCQEDISVLNPVGLFSVCPDMSVKIDDTPGSTQKDFIITFHN